MGKSYQQLITSMIGEIGRSQILIVIATRLATGIVGYAMLLMSFIAAEPKWWKVASVFNETSNSSIINGKCPILPNETVIFDNSMQTIVNEWQLVCENKWIPSVIMTILMVGVLLGVLINGQVGDSFGRRKVLLVNFGVMLISVAVVGFSVNWKMMAACGFFGGAACGAFLTVADVYYIEFIGTSWRTAVSCIPGWTLGTMLLGGAIKLFGNWRYVCFTGAVVGLPVLLALWFCPESIRWLFVNGQTEQGKDVIKRIIHSNGKDEPDLANVATQIEEIVHNENREQAAYNYHTIFKCTYTRRIVLLFGFIWFSMSISYYVVSFGVGSLHGDISLNMTLMGLVQTFGVVSVWLFSKCFGRKNSSFIFLILASLTCFGITVAFFKTSPTTFGKIQLGLAITSIFWMSSFWRNVSLHTLEVFPTVLRSLGIASVSLFARIGGMFAPQVAALDKVSAHLPFTVIGVLTFLAAFCCLPLQETYTSELDDYLDQAQILNIKQSEQRSDEHVV